MGLFIRPAGSYKFVRRAWVRVAGVWRRVQYLYRRSPSTMLIDSNYNQGLELSAFTQSADIGSANGEVSYYLASSNSSEYLSNVGKSSLVLNGAFFNLFSASVGSNGFRSLTLRAWVHGADVFPIPSSVTVTVYNSGGGAIGSITLPLTSNDGANLRYSVSGPAAAAIAEAIRADFTVSPSYRRIAMYF